jgi:hypothetical protein
VSNCYSAGARVRGSSPQAGLIGYTETPFKYSYWNASALEGNFNHGVIGCTIDGTNSSFVLTGTAAAMGTIVDGLETGNTGEDKWRLEVVTLESGQWALPLLVNNVGRAEPVEKVSE